MFSHHPFTVHGRYSLDVSALPTWKRVLDLVCCVIGIPLLGLVTFLTSVAALISSSGPIIFRQEKVSASGRRFAMYRFRTMRVLFSPVVSGDTSSLRRNRSQAETPALIAGGELLRATGLVDLPQLINVLRGEMSIVGPRPDAFSLSAASAGAAYDREASVPGITGQWRLCADEGATLDELRQWDRTYAETRSLGGDLSIIARSLCAAVTLRIRS